MSGVKERPILFSGPMVRALLAGRKTQTRRVVKLQPPADAHEVFFWSGEDLRRTGWSNVSEPGLWARRNGRDGYIQHVGHCPYGVPGDRLWVRETWCASDTPNGYAYAADFLHDTRGYGWRPSIHMPRAACRIRLAITDVRAERLNACSSGDAEAEGVVFETADPPFYYVPGIWPHSLTAVGVEESRTPAQDSYRKLWNHINGPGSWDANPWVWALTFEVVS